MARVALDHALRRRRGDGKPLRPAERHPVAEPFPHPLRIEPEKKWRLGGSKW
jgi:hypothetical protein